MNEFEQLVHETERVANEKGLHLHRYQTIWEDIELEYDTPRITQKRNRITQTCAIT